MTTPPWGEQPEDVGPPPPPPPSGSNPYAGTPGPASPYQPYAAASPYGGYTVTPPTNGLAIASLVVSIVGALGLCCYGVGGIVGLVGAILGHVARRQIREQQQGGDGLSLAGVIVGWIAFGIGMVVLALFVVFVIIGVAADNSYDDCYYNSNDEYVCY